MLHIDIIDIKQRKLSINDAEKFISSSDYGASIIFTGTVRNHNNDKNVVGITYDSHDALILKSFNEIYNETKEKLNIKESKPKEEKPKPKAKESKPKEEKPKPKAKESKPKSKE